MKNAPITVVIGSNNYTLREDAPEGMRDIPEPDRKALIALLEQLKLQDQLSQQLIDARLAKSASNVASGGIPAGADAHQASPEAQSGERLGAGDIDALMVRLAAEERNSKKAGVKPTTIYKWAAAIVVVILLLSVI